MCVCVFLGVNLQDDTKFYESGQCVACGDLLNHFSNMIWGTLLQKCQRDANFAAEVDNVRAAKKRGTSLVEGAVQKARRMMYAMIRTVWFLTETDFLGRFGNRTPPQSLGLEYVELHDGMQPVKGILMAPEVGDPPFLWRRLEISNSVFTTHNITLASEGTLMRVHEGDELIEKTLRTSFSDEITQVSFCCVKIHWFVLLSCALF